MSSGKSSSSKSRLDLEAMLDLSEEDLDYEPDGDSGDEVNTKQGYIKNHQQYCQAFSERQQDRESSNEGYLQDPDYRHQLPEPSGQEDQDSSNQTSSDRDRHSYETELEKAPSIAPSFRSDRDRHSYETELEKAPSIAPSFRSERPSYGTELEKVPSNAPSFRSERPSYQKELEKVPSIAPSFLSERPSYGTELEKVPSIAPSFRSDRDRHSYETELDKVPSLAPSFRDKINYNDLHLDVEKDSYRNRFAQHSQFSGSFHVDSSDDEPELSDSDNQLLESEDENVPIVDPNYLGPESPQESQRLFNENDYASIESSNLDGNRTSLKDSWEVATTSEATTDRIDYGVDLPYLSHVGRDNTQEVSYAQMNNTIDNSTVDPLPKKRTSLNFSIQVVGNDRIYIPPKEATPKKKSRMPWLSKVGNFLRDITILRSGDEVIRHVPDIEPTCGIRNRLGAFSDVKSRLGPSSLASQSLESTSSVSLFKIPLKRPPTRQKSTSKNLSISVDVNSRQKKVTEVGDLAPLPIDNSINQEDTDDMISLIASTCHLSTTDEQDNSRDLRNEIVRDKPLSYLGSSTGTERAKIERTAQWVSKAAEGPPKIDRTIDVPAIYRGLCYAHFFSNRCSVKLCNKSHLLVTPHTRIHELSSLNMAELYKAYGFAKEYPVFYGVIYKYFAQAFATKDIKIELINMVHLIFEESFHKIDKEEGLNNVLNALENTDLSTFEDAVDYLLLQIGLKRYPMLGEVLLEIICKKPDLPKLWPVIRKLIMAGEKMSVKLGRKFLINLMRTPVDHKVCKEMYQLILKYKFMNLPQVENLVKDPFLKICSQEDTSRLPTSELEATIAHNLSKARFNVVRTVQDSAKFTSYIPPMPSQFSVPPPYFASLKSNQAPARPLAFNFVPTIEFGSGLSHQPDFASLSRQNTSFAPEANQFTYPPPAFDAPPPTFDAPPRVFNEYDTGRAGSSSQSNSVPLRDMAFRYSIGKRHNTSSEDGQQSPIGNQLSDSDSSTEQSSAYFHRPELNSGATKRRAPTGLMYNREGLQYDPANDYACPSKRRRSKTQPTSDWLQESNVSRAIDQPVEGHRSASSLAVNEVILNRSEPTFSHFDRLRVGRDMYEQTSESIQGVGHNIQGMGPAFERPNHDVQEARPVFQRPNNDVQQAGLSFEQPNQTAEETGIAPAEAPVTNRRLNLRVRRLEFNTKSNEAAVSSSSDAKLMDDKPPEHPQFGNLYFDPNYEFNVSLHNLYLQAIDSIDIDEEDVHSLNDCVKVGDGQMFLRLVEKYKGPKTVQNFISMTLAHLKGMNQMVARTYQRLLDSIEKENGWFYGKMYIRVILEVITMNLLFELYQRNMLEAATNFLTKFSNWDSLVTSRLFINSTHKGVSIVGRYLFIAKILTVSKPELTYEILVCPTLHLLEKYEIWPYYPPCPIPEIFSADLETRNGIIVHLLKKGYLLNTVVVLQLYKTAFKKKIWEMDIRSYVNPMVIDMINRNLIVSLKQIHNEMNVFCKHMGQDTLRGFVVTMYKHLGDSDLYRMYERCVERKIYQRLVRGETMEYIIEIKTNRTICEIELIIKYYFFKLAELKNVPPGSESLTFVIILPGETSPKSLPILNTDKSIVKTAEALIHILKKQCSLASQVVVPNMVKVEKKELVNYLEGLWK